MKLRSTRYSQTFITGSKCSFIVLKPSSLLLIPGGLGADTVTSCLLEESFAYGCAGVTVALGGNGLACAPLKVAANQEQKTEYFGMSLFLLF